ELETVLRPFERGAETHNSGVSGVGLGLSISKALVELHDAEMTISSAPGDGTAITISFPAARSYPRQNAVLSE
ncbi:MAG TPA: two-component sensor histidine kinase, partial [Alphaproteobacteria bacterium]|nr:two-component sensor histidine kinase [Alphaproteobacteria bacterium]